MIMRILNRLLDQSFRKGLRKVSNEENKRYFVVFFTQLDNKKSIYPIDQYGEFFSNTNGYYNTSKQVDLDGEMIDIEICFYKGIVVVNDDSIIPNGLTLEQTKDLSYEKISNEVEFVSGKSMTQEIKNWKKEINDSLDNDKGFFIQVLENDGSWKTYTDRDAYDYFDNLEKNQLSKNMINDANIEYQKYLEEENPVVEKIKEALELNNQEEINKQINILNEIRKKYQYASKNNTFNKIAVKKIGEWIELEGENFDGTNSFSVAKFVSAGTKGEGYDITMDGYVITEYNVPKKLNRSKDFHIMQTFIPLEEIDKDYPGHQNDEDSISMILQDYLYKGSILWIIADYFLKNIVDSKRKLEELGIN
jgi:hypothetical protein